MKSEDQEVYIEVLKKIVETMQKIVNFCVKKAFSAICEPTTTKKLRTYSNDFYVFKLLLLELLIM